MVGSFIGAYHSSAQTLPSGFSRQLVNGTLSQLTAMVMADDGRIFLTQQTGQVRVITAAGTLNTAPFLTVAVDATSERGLLGITLDPAFATNGYVYVYYTVPGTPAHNRVSRFTAIGDIEIGGTEEVILELDNLSTANIHNGGALIFGTDGKLYVGVGDNSNGSNAQNPETHKGKILRLNPDGSVPADNPNAGGSAHAALIWSMGVRNPFAFSRDRKTGKIFVLDVGANLFEEINDVTVGGKNFGWPTAEGYWPNPANPPYPNYSDPVYSYPHGGGDGVGCAITGGTFFSPMNTNYPSTYYGKFFFMDYCEKWINTIDPSTNPATPSPFALNVATLPLYLTAGVDGNLYFLTRGASIYRLVYAGTSPPFILTQPADASVNAGESVSFSVHAIGSNPISYQWKKDNAAIPGATSATYEITSAAASDEGPYTVVVTNGAGTVTSNPAVLDVEMVTGVEPAASRIVVPAVLYPNPVLHGSSATLVIHASITGPAKVVVMDRTGRGISSVDFSLTSGVNHFTLPTGDLLAGFYLVTIDAMGIRHRMKLIIGN